MSDDNRHVLSDRLIALLEADGATVERVKARALSARHRPRRSRRSLVVATLVLAMVGVGTYSVWHGRASEVQVVTIERSEDDLMLARTPDGGEWVLGAAENEPAPPGTMEVVLEGGR